jgi:HAD superfamily hydrolase (TIGR01509 family)
MAPVASITLVPVRSKLKKLPYKAVIFDLDGVLADTEPINFRAIQDMFNPAQLKLDEQDYAALYGLDYFATAEYLRRRYDLDEAIDSLVYRQEICAIHRIDLELEPAQGVLDLLRRLHQHGIPLGLASNSPCVYVNHVLERLGVAEFIQFPVGRDDVVQGKPDPAPYLEACRRLGVDPTLSLAVEDSAVGMRSALSAGLAVALVGHAAPAPPSPRVTRFVNIIELANSLLSN